MSQMIKELTPDQEAMIPKYVRKCRDSVFSKKENRKASESIIRELYEDIGEDEPIVLHFTSPLIAYVAAILLPRKKGEDYKLHSQLDSKLHSQLHLQLHSKLRSQLYSQLHPQLRSQLYSQIHFQLHSQLHPQLRSQLRSQIHFQLHSQLHPQLRSQLRSQLDSKLRSQLDSQLHCWYPFWWNTWLAMYDYGEYIGAKLDQDILAKFRRFVSNVHFLIPYKGVCFVSDRPTSVTWNNQGRLHNEEHAAVEYSDGNGLYALDGVRLEKKLWQKITSKSLSFAEIQKIGDIDVKAVAMKHMPAKDFLEGAKAELVGKKTGRGNELWRVPREAGIFDDDEHFLRYSCPSSGREYLEAVPPDAVKESNDPDYCMAMRHNLALEQYLDKSYVST